MQRIAVLTGGGDAPGMNASIRAVVRAGIARGMTVLGVRRGFTGLIENDFIPLGARDVGNIIQRGGTILGSARCAEFREPDYRDRAAQNLREHEIEGLVTIGGDGTVRASRALTDHWSGGIVAIPASIDNDVYGTESTVGFDTAVNTALEAIDRIRDTAEAQRRVFIVEVMGRGSGAIALDVALAGGAVAALIPELHNDLDGLLEFLHKAHTGGRSSSIIVVAEGDESGGAFKLAARLEPHLGTPLRVSVLGHMQRGGSPTAASRILGTRFGVAAVEALLEGDTGVMVGIQGNEVVRVPFSEVEKNQHGAPAEMVRLIVDLAR